MLEQWKELIVKYVEVDPDKITEDSRFAEDLGFTSYDFMSMVGEIEDLFDIEVEEREVADIKTVGEAIQYVKSLME